MRIVTSGSTYVDIDAYAGCTAYAELLQKQDKEAYAICTAPLNESISKTVRSWKAPLLTEYKSQKNDTFALIDVSDPVYFDKIVDLSRVQEVIDHHPGFEAYWNKLLGEDACIEFIGAACTLVYERWKTAGLLRKMSVISARLLVCGILDNTLNFGAKIISDRDIEAYKALLDQADLPNDWTAQYFTECQEAILKNAVAAIQNDTKTLTFKSFERPICFGQLVVWEGKRVLGEHQQALQQAFVNRKPDWLISLISVSERKNYFITENKNVQAWLSKLLNVQFDESVAISSRVWLRKEVINQDIIHFSRCTP